MNKRGQGLSITSIILIILGVLVLVFLIIGFSMGWSKVLPWIKPSNNVKDISDACKLACNTGSKYDYCSVTRKLFAENNVKLEDNCYFYAKKKTQFGIEECDSIDCNIYEDLPSAQAACVGPPVLQAGQILRYLDNDGTKLHTC